MLSNSPLYIFDIDPGTSPNHVRSNETLRKNVKIDVFLPKQLGNFYSRVLTARVVTVNFRLPRVWGNGTN